MNRDDFCNFFINWIPIPKLRKYLYIMLQMKIHPTAHIMRNCQFLSLKDIYIDKRSQVGHDCFLDAKGGICIGKDVVIASYSKIITAKHIVDDIDFKGIDKPIKINDRVWIATGATILQGIEIGEGAVVAAGSVVHKNVEPFTIVGGIPAKKIGERNKKIRYKINSKPSRFL